MKAIVGLLVLAVLVSCQSEDEAVVEELEAVGYAMTPANFHRAVEAGDVEVMATMVGQGVDPFAKIAGETALHVAARVGQNESMEFLLRQGLPIEVLGQGGRTPLMVAAEENEVGAVELLLAYGADDEVRDNLGYRAMTLAAGGGCTEVVKLLAANSQENIDDAMFLAALQGHEKTVEALIVSGASVYARMEDGKTVLMMVAREGHELVAEVLLRHGANRYAVDAEGLTAGQIAMSAGQSGVGEMLLAPPGREAFSFPDLPVFAEADMQVVNVAGEDFPSEGESEGLVEGEVAGALPSAEGSAPVVAEGRPSVQLVTAKSGGAIAPQARRAPVIAMKEYHERPLPMRVEGVKGKQVRVRYLFGENKRVTVEEGDEIPFTGLRVVKVQERRRRTKESGNSYVDVSVVRVEDPRTGLQRDLVAQLSASAHEPFAVVGTRNGANQLVGQGSLLRSAEGDRFRVLDVRPTQVVLESLATGEVTTVNLAGRQ